MTNEFSFEITNESKNAINEILKQQGLRHFKLYTDFYGELDVVIYEEYQKLEKEIDKLNNTTNELEKWLNDEINRINKIINKEKPYGEELHLYQNAINCYTYALDKLKELKEGNRSDN